MAYDSSSHIVSAPVNLWDVQVALSNSSNNVGALCRASNINKWAKYKPVALAVIDTVTGQWNKEANKWNKSGDQGVLPAHWWQADGGCGLTFSVVTTISSTFISNLISGALQWTYSRPTGGAAQPYRLQDFAQYFHDAEPAVGRLYGAGRTVYVDSSGSGMRTLTLNYDAPSADDENLTLADFKDNNTSFTQYYLGVLLYESSDNYRIVTSENKIGSIGSTLIECEIGYSDIGTWQVMPFISSVKIEAYGSIPSGRFMSAGYPSADTIIIAPSGTVYRIEASGTWADTNHTKVGINAIVKNNNSTAKTFSGGITIYIYETPDTATSGVDGTKKAQYTYPTSFTVQANSSYTIPANQYSTLLDDYFIAFLNVTRQEGKEYWVTANFVDGTSTDNAWETVTDQIMPDI